MTTKKEIEASEGVPDVRSHKVVDGEHDLSNHPGIKRGIIGGAGTTATEDPAKKASGTKAAKQEDESGSAE